MNAPKYDGNFTIRWQTGPLIRSVDEITRAIITKGTYWLQAAYYQPLPRGSLFAGIDGYLVEQPEPRNVGADILEFDLIFAQIPRARTEKEPWVYSFQYIQGDELAEFPMATNSLVSYSYVHTADPASIPLAVAFKAVKVGDSIRYFGTRPTINQWTLAEDEQLRRWKGDIWEVQSRAVLYRANFGA